MISAGQPYKERGPGMRFRTDELESMFSRLVGKLKSEEVSSTSFSHKSLLGDE